MVLCPQCSSSLTVVLAPAPTTCSGCGLQLSSQDHTLVFHPALSGVHDGMAPEIYDDLAGAEERHFWMSNRRQVILSAFRKYVTPDARIIEIGAGTGDVARFLMREGYPDVAVGDVHLAGLEYARRYGIRSRYQFDLVNSPFVDHFDAVCLFDVMEHIDDEDSALRAVHRMLKGGGRIVVTVPAHMWLWSRADATAFHRRRYTLAALTDRLARNNFKVLHARYFFLSLVPFLYARTLVARDNRALRPDDFKNRFGVPRVFNRLFGGLLALERRLCGERQLPWGGSILLVAEK